MTAQTTEGTRRKGGVPRIDRDLATVQAMLENAEAIAQIGSWEFRPDKDVLILSDGFFRIFGLDPDPADAPGLEGVYELVHPDDLEELRTEIARMTADPAVRPPIEFRIIRPGGEQRHLRASVALVDATPGARRFVGLVEDRSDHHRYEREIAAHIAVSSALADWRDFPTGAELLLRRLGRAMHLDRGIFWIPEEDLLAPRVSWYERGAATPESRRDAAETRVPRGTGMSGSAWEKRAPVSVSDIGTQVAYSYRQAALREGLRGAIAFPALHDDEVLAVLGFAGRERIELTDRLSDCLLSIGTEVGSFLSRRRAELSPPVLSKRQLEVLQLAADGHPGPRIAERLHISLATVRTHFEHIYERLGVSDRGTAVATALREGLIE